MLQVANDEVEEFFRILCEIRRRLSVDRQHMSNRKFSRNPRCSREIVQFKYGNILPYLGFSRNFAAKADGELRGRGRQPNLLKSTEILYPGERQ
jgi:hypothetical protein